MAKLKHLAIATQDPDSVADFYKSVFELDEVGRVDNSNAEGYYLTDGNINIAVLHFKNEVVAGEGFAPGYSGLHHIGFPGAGCGHYRRGAPEIERTGHG